MTVEKKDNKKNGATYEACPMLYTRLHEWPINIHCDHPLKLLFSVLNLSIISLGGVSSLVFVATLCVGGPKAPATRMYPFFRWTKTNRIRTAPRRSLYARTRSTPSRRRSWCVRP